jgi:outer membrane receptor protein involved in Fe transport
MRRETFRRVPWGLAGLGLLWAALAAAPQALAQQQRADDAEPAEAAPAGAAAPPRSRSGVEAITVTARKREENLQEVPIAVTAFSADDLRQREINVVGDIRLSTRTCSSCAASTAPTARACTSAAWARTT